MLTISSESPLPSNVHAKLLSAMNANGEGSLVEIPFVLADAHTLNCEIVPDSTGFYSFRAEFSLDEGATWQRDNVPDAWILVDPPQVDALRLYTLIPTVSGTLADWKSDLRRIQSMGFNAVHLLPVTSLDTSESPYAAHDLFDIDHSYLMTGARSDGLSQLEEFIEEARTLEIRLCFDLVLNHIGVHSTMAQRAPDWIKPDQTQQDGLLRARYWLDQGWHDWKDLVLINYEHPSDAVRSEIWRYMIEYALFWAKYAEYTGGFVRFDNLHRSDPKFVPALAAALHSEYPSLGVLAEYFTDDQTLLRSSPDWGLNLILATPWNYKFVPQLRDYLKWLHSVSAHIRYFMPVTSHDCGSPAQEFGNVDSTVPRYVAAALLGTGATGITQGVEYGEAERIDFIGRKPKIPQPDEARYARFISRVNSILSDFTAFRRGENCQFVDGDHRAVIAAFRRDDGPQSSGFLVACNFDTNQQQNLVVDLASLIGERGPWLGYEMLSCEQKQFDGPLLELCLAPCEAQVLKFPN